MNNQRIPSIEMGMSNTGIQNQRKALWAVATIAFAVALHPARANAQGGGAPTDPQIVGSSDSFRHRSGTVDIAKMDLY
jgi:hypothetical protein